MKTYSELCLEPVATLLRWSYYRGGFQMRLHCTAVVDAVLTRRTKIF